MNRCTSILVLFVCLFAVVIVSSFSNSKKIDDVTLGKELFFDKILSSDKSISCASCHIPQFAFADTLEFSKGVNGKLAKRNTPSVMNVASREALFWDGRANTLEAQVVGPIENPNEMNLPFAQAVKRIQNSIKYQKLFKQVYHTLPDSQTIVTSIAAYERSLETSDTPNDRWLNDEPNGLSEQQIRGRELFKSDRTKCFDCHFTPDFTSDEFKNIGLFNGQELNDSGRYTITKKIEDIGKFKIPGLRNVAITAPYMHDGRFKTLREVIDYYNNPNEFIHNSLNRDTILPKQINLTETEKNDLESFLHALTDDRFTKQ